MYYASVNFPRRVALRKAVAAGENVVLYNPEIGVPAVEGVVTVVGPWGVNKYETKDPKFMLSKHGWAVRCRVRDMRVVAVY